MGRACNNLDGGRVKGKVNAMLAESRLATLTC